MELGYLWIVLCFGFAASSWSVYRSLGRKVRLEDRESELLLPFYEAFYRINFWKLLREEEFSETRDVVEIDISCMREEWDEEFSYQDSGEEGAYQIMAKRAMG